MSESLDKDDLLKLGLPLRLEDSRAIFIDLCNEVYKNGCKREVSETYWSYGVSKCIFFGYRGHWNECPGPLFFA